MFAEPFDDPIAAFLAGWDRVYATAPAGWEPASVTLATSAPDGEPSARVVLLKGADERGFVFFTNYDSPKALALDANPRAALCFFWYWLGQQVRVEGRVTRVSPEESDEYFASRPRGSQVGAWASRQSEPLDARATLETRYRELEAQYEGASVPRPPWWGGYRLLPDRVEFWQEGEWRLHDRLRFTRTADGWIRQRLYP